jgi:CubicO group peptidase (beta-lactamase class C family)
MKSTVLTSILALALWTPAVAQQAGRAGRFKQLDRNGDGKVSREEAGSRPFFDAADKNKDGSLTIEEGREYFAGRRATRPATQPSKQAETLSPTPRTPRRPRSAGTGDLMMLVEPPHKKHLNLRYAEIAGIDPNLLSLDLYVPDDKPASAKRPVMIMIHGGGWRNGDKANPPIVGAKKNVAGLIALIHGNGQRGYCETFGMADIEAGKPMPEDAIFRLMSMTKPVIAVAALTLVDEGRFTLDEPIAKHCPEWSAPQVLEGGSLVPAKSAITPRMLMSHSSGLYYGNLAGAPTDRGQGAAAMAFRATRTPGTTLREFSEALARQPLKFHPGEGYQYGHSIDILGRYLEAVTGKPLDELLKERLFVPLKMADTDFWVPPEKSDRLCQIYRQPRPGVLEPGRSADRPTAKPTLFLGGHGLLSTLGDYERFCHMILNRGELEGVRVLKAETVDMIFENHLRFPGPQKYGLGGGVNGAGTYGWGGADGTQFVIDRAHSYFAIFMVQTQGYKAPTYPAFLTLAREAAGIAGPGLGGASDMGYALRQRDRNGDGKLDRQELPAALLERLDANQDGVVTEEEMKALWRRRQ